MHINEAATYPSACMLMDK